MRGIRTIDDAFSTLASAQEAAASPSTPKEKLSYALGMNLAKQFKSQSIDVDPAVFAQGMRDALAGGKTALTEEEARTVMAAFQDDMGGRRAAMMAQAAEKNRKEGETFLAANKAKEGVVTLPSGLQYKIVKVGTGPKPALDDTVVCHSRARSSTAPSSTARTSGTSRRSFR